MLLCVTAQFKNIDYAQQTVGGTQAAITPPTRNNAGKVCRPDAIFVQAEPANTGKITIGSTGVAAGGAGITLSATSNLLQLPITDYANIFIIGSAAGQKLNIIYCYGPQ